MFSLTQKPLGLNIFPQILNQEIINFTIISLEIKPVKILYKSMTSKNPQRNNIIHPKTPDGRIKSIIPDDLTEASKLHQKQCKFWKFGKCNWGWGCRFLHGNSLSDDPRRVEYHGPPIDFTQFPRLAHFSPQINISSPLHSEDQSRVKTLRKPIVEIISESKNYFQTYLIIKDNLLLNGIDIYQNIEFLILSNEEVKLRLEKKLSDYIIFIEGINISVYPNSEILNTKNLCSFILKDWKFKNDDLNSDQIELLTNIELENIIKRLTHIENIESTISTLQDETSDALISFYTETCKFKESNLISLKTKLLNYFSKLNLANSIISDLPIYNKTNFIQGTIINTPLIPSTQGLSWCIQKVLCYITGKGLTQLHMCIYQINKLLNDVNPPNNNFINQINLQSGCLNPISLCPPNISNICSDENIPIQETGKKIEPAISVDMSTSYSVSFRDNQNRNFNPFNKF